MNFVHWIIILVVVIAAITFYSVFNISLWFRAMMSGAHVKLSELFSITVKKLDARSIVNNYIKAKKAGVDITIAQIENHLQAHGNIELVINALIAASSANLKDLDLKTAIASAYKKVEKISFANAYYRRDIGQRALKALTEDK